MQPDQRVEDVLRRSTPQVLGALVRRYGQFDICEDAVQEALLAAAQQWPAEGVPANPYGWLLKVASRRLIDQVRSEQARRQRETRLAAATLPADLIAPPASDGRGPDRDDTLSLFFLCCHPALTPPTQIALTLRAVGGLSTADIAAAFLLPESTMAQRISRAKQKIRDAGASFSMPTQAEWPGRLDTVLKALYLIFNEGYTASSGSFLARAELSTEAIRLTRELKRLVPRNGEVAGLLALMLLTDARRLARADPAGNLIPLAEQDRSRWNQAYIAEGVELISSALSSTPLGPYQLQAAIAAVHDEAPSAADTDWPQILALYETLDRIAPSPVVTLNRAVAVSMVTGPLAGLELLESLNADGELHGHHRVNSVRAHLLERVGQPAAARTEYLLAARRTNSLAERRFLLDQAARLESHV
ncbi:RNA polymerase sigma factor [Jatrophihabitans sp. DSM 45814]